MACFFTTTTPPQSPSCFYIWYAMQNYFSVTNSIQFCKWDLTVRIRGGGWRKREEKANFSTPKGYLSLSVKQVFTDTACENMSMWMCYCWLMARKGFAKKSSIQKLLLWFTICCLQAEMYDITECKSYIKCHRIVQMELPLTRNARAGIISNLYARSNIL